MAGTGARALLLLGLAACLLATAAAGADRMLLGEANRKANWDYLYLVRQWPATFCNDHSCTHRPPKKYTFTIHGLWPQRRDGTWPEYCKPGDHLRMQDLWRLLPEMEDTWPSWSSDDEVFWDHEWERHGTCAVPVIGSQVAFFKAVLRLHRHLNIQAALKDAGIRPSNRKTYPVQDIKDAIDDAYGVMPHVTCDAQGALEEIWMCINKKLKPIDCVDGPHPHARAAAAAAAGDDDAAPEPVGAAPAAAAPARLTYNCNMVRIPKLRRGGHGDELAALAAAEQDSEAAQEEDEQDEDEEEADEQEADEQQEQEADERQEQEEGEQQEPAPRPKCGQAAVPRTQAAFGAAAVAAALRAAAQPAAARAAAGVSRPQHLPLLVLVVAAAAAAAVAAVVAAAAARSRRAGNDHPVAPCRGRDEHAACAESAPLLMA